MTKPIEDRIAKWRERPYASAAYDLLREAEAELRRLRGELTLAEETWEEWEDIAHQAVEILRDIPAEAMSLPLRMLAADAIPVVNAYDRMLGPEEADQ